MCSYRRSSWQTSINFIGKGKRSSFIAEIVEREMRRQKLLRALDDARGCWKGEDHPELKNGSAAWVKELRAGMGHAFAERRLMTRFLLDTTFLIDVLNEQRDRYEVMKDLSPSNSTILPAAPSTSTEVYSGMRGSETRKDRGAPAQPRIHPDHVGSGKARRRVAASFRRARAKPFRFPT